MAADGLDGNGLQLEKFRLNSSSCFRMSSKKLKLIAAVLFLSANLTYIFVLFFKDDDFHGLSCPPIISEEFKQNSCDIAPLKTPNGPIVR